MRPNTSESGIFSTNRNRPVSTSMLTRILVPKPKKAFQSVAVHNTGLRVVFTAVPLAECRRPAHLVCYFPPTETDASVLGLPGMNQTRETSASEREASMVKPQLTFAGSVPSVRTHCKQAVCQGCARLVTAH